MVQIYHYISSIHVHKNTLQSQDTFKQGVETYQGHWEWLSFDKMEFEDVPPPPLPRIFFFPLVLDELLEERLSAANCCSIAPKWNLKTWCIPVHVHVSALCHSTWTCTIQCKYADSRPQWQVLHVQVLYADWLHTYKGTSTCMQLAIVIRYCVWKVLLVSGFTFPNNVWTEWTHFSLNLLSGWAFTFFMS